MITKDMKHIPSLCKVVNTKKQDFNNGYIVASEEAYDLLIADGYKPFSFNTKYGKDYFEVGGEALLDVKFQRVVFTSLDKQFYINNGKLSWDEPIQINSMEDLNGLPTEGEVFLSEPSREIKQDDYVTSYIPTTTKTLTITDKDGKVCGDCRFKNDKRKCPMADPEAMADNNYCYNWYAIKPKWYEDETAKDLLQNIRKYTTKPIEYIDDTEDAEKISDIIEILDSLYCEN